MTDDRDKIFYRLFSIKDEDRSLFPKNIGNNFIMNKQGYLLNTIGYDQEMFERYKKAFNREDDTEVRGLCSYLCAYVARHNLLANKDTFSKKFFDFLTEENCIRIQESRKSLIDDLMNEAKTDDQYFVDTISQNSQAAFQKLNEIEKEIKKLKNIANSKKYPEKSKQISELSSRHKKIRKDIKNRFNAKYQYSQETTSTPENFVRFIDENLKLSAKNENGYSFLCFMPRNILFKEQAGHALLIKKNEDGSFAFYDPNFVAVFGLTKEELCRVVIQVFSIYKTDSKFYKYQLNECEYFAHGRLASTLVLWSAAIICLASLSTGITVMVSGGAIIPTVSFMLLSTVLFAGLCLIRHLSKNLECEMKILYQGYIKLHDFSAELFKERPYYDSVELDGIPNVSEISQLSQDVENVMQELVDMQETSDKEPLNIKQVFSGSALGV